MIKDAIYRGQRIAAVLFSVAAIFIFAVLPDTSYAQWQKPIHPTEIDNSYGPYNGIFLQGGKGLIKLLPLQDSLFQAASPWTISCWAKSNNQLQASTLLAGVGNTQEEYARYFGVVDGKVTFWMGPGNSLHGTASWSANQWHLLVATFDGVVTRLYVDGSEVANGKLTLGAVSAELQMAPTDLPQTHQWSPGQHFGGHIAAFTVERDVLTNSAVKAMATQPPDFSLIEFEEGSKDWPIQTRQQAGYRAPQDPSTMPKSAAPFSKPIAITAINQRATLPQNSSNDWTLANGWKLVAAPKAHADGAQLSQPGYKTQDWLDATVPGTVLTTMVDRGVYPDPDYGLNNLAIPESLNKQDYWYRVQFNAPKLNPGQHLTLTFNGINYAAVVWLNGTQLGTIKGAFIRGTFDVTSILKAGKLNALAVLISPPPHPGIPQEQSIQGGPGENGGIMCLDGPTFVATEGWDWIPGVRDRDTGIWQDVQLHATSQIQIGDPQVITTLPLPDTSRADVSISVPLHNVSTAPVKGTLRATFGSVVVTKDVTVAPGDSTIQLSPADFSQLTVMHPRLWWPNGYGKPDFYQLQLQFSSVGGDSDQKQLHFGIREITYELSLLDPSGKLRRVEYSPTVANLKHQLVVNVTHQGMREIPNGWVASILPGAENSLSLQNLDDNQMAPYLVIKVNGVRIAARGGNWGMDDSRKRVSREHLEPYFRLHRDANLNIIRNWVGQNTEETFYELADKYGLMVWNDFWDSTQNYNVEAQDPALFLANARDTILRFRNHPSIVMWCGRNEGVPQPIINEGLDNLVRALDGTRYYSPSSNQVNLQNSGPYRYQNPVDYYTKLNKGFSVETGTPSMSTLESFRSTIPKADQWPISDDWAYHDWHQSGNGDTAPFMKEIEEEFGAPTSLEDFERKAQLLNYVDHRAIFEGFNAHLWAPNSGRLLWMTQPAWPSTMWQILSSDYDTQASFYGVKESCEPVHVQLDLSNYTVAVVNTTTAAQDNLSLTANVYSLDNKLLLTKEQTITAKTDAVTNAFHLNLEPLMLSGVVFVQLDLKGADGKLLSQNIYWLGANNQAYRALNTLPAVSLVTSATATLVGDEMHLHVTLQNSGNSVALAAKLTLENAKDSSRILPAYFTDNYITIMPGQTRKIEISYPIKAAMSAPRLGLRGWNIVSKSIAITTN